MSDTQTLDYGPGTPAPARLTPTLRARLSTMMLIQYMVWGAWWVVLSIYLDTIGFSGEQIGAVYGTMAIASIFAPLVFGQIADRWVPTQFLLAGMHLVGAAVLFQATRYTAFKPFYICVLIYALIFIPTISLTNALAFHQIPDAAKHFPSIRVFGTIGWIIAGLFVGWRLDDTTTQPIHLACGISVAMGVYCLTLPHTPPSGKAGDALPFVKALSLVRHGPFALFLVVSFIVAVVLAGYFVFTPPFLKSDTVNIERVAPVASIMTVGQFTEMLLLPFLPFFLKRIGMKWTLALGMAAWGIRYGIFALGHPVPLIIIGIALHGVCYDFFFVAAYIHVDNRASRDMRASAQALFNIVTMGLGMWLGTILFGKLKDHYTHGDVVAWTPFWALPALGVVIALVIFGVGFRTDRRATPAAPAANAD